MCLGLQAERNCPVPEALTERVLVVPTELFHRLGYFQGFSCDTGRYLADLLSPEHTSYRPRSEVEQDPGFKQLIPYVILSHRGADGRQTVFQYTRGTGQGEGRLHRKRSVGIGGHISTVDAGTDGGSKPYEEGMRRELEEEVAVRSPYTTRCVGLINDDQTEVGRVHLGVVHRFELEQPLVEPREEDILECGFRPVEEILADLSAFESWSQICLRALYGTERA
ncbi:MAG: phosphoesterase [Pirellulales bacterium]|nr:phosphoesterase [Pirellulales bacterium]